MINKLLEKHTPEQRSLIISVTILATTMAILFSIYGLSNTLINKQKKQFKKQQQTINWLNDHAPRLLLLRASYIQTTPIAGQTLASIVSHGLEQLHLNQFKPDISSNQSRHLTLTFQSVPFIKLYELSLRLWQGNQINVVKLKTQKTTKPGVVKAEITFSKK